jgi:hypothetical protein
VVLASPKKLALQKQLFLAVPPVVAPAAEEELAGQAVHEEEVVESAPYVLTGHLQLAAAVAPPGWTPLLGQAVHPTLALAP